MMNKLLFVVLALFVVYSLGADTQSKPFTANGVCKNIEPNGICRVELSFSDGLGAVPNGIINDPAQYKLTTTNFIQDPTSYDVDVCFTMDSTLSTSSYKACPDGAMASFEVSNDTQANNVLLKSYKNAPKEASNSLKNRFTNRFSQKSLEQIFADNEADTSLYLIPGTKYAVVSFKNLDKATNLTVHLEGTYCPGNGEIWDGVLGDDKCVDEPTTGMPNKAKVAAGTTALYKYDATAFTGANQVSFNWTTEADSGNDVDVYVSNSFYPTKDFNYGSIPSEGEQTFYCEGNCGYFYFTVVNSGTTDYDFTLQEEKTSCPDGFYGNGCMYNTTNTLTVVNQLNTTGTVGNLDSGFAYFELDFTNVGDSYVRVSVAPVDDDDGPGLYLRKGGRPTLTQYDEMLDSGDAVNQIQIDYVVGQNWYAMLVTTEDEDQADEDDAFVIWAGPNCLDKCNDKGNCICNGVNCTATNQFELVTLTTDSYGTCACEDDKGDFQCDASSNKSSSSSGFWTTTTIVIVVIIVILIICLIIGAIAGGLYWYKTKKRGEYESV